MFQKPSSDIALSYTDPEYNSNNDDVETVVGPSVNVEGDFASEGNILVKGTVAGSVKTSRLLTVEVGAKILANIRAGHAIISGDVKGNIKVEEQVELTPTAKVAGDIECKTLVIAAGALLYGKVVMKGVEMETPKMPRRQAVRKGVREFDDASSDMQLDQVEQ